MSMAHRRGRLPRAARDARREEVLDAGLDHLVEVGADAMTMLGVARRAGASKETLYSWFGDREGLLSAMIERNAAATAARIEAALGGDDDPVVVLSDIARGLLTLLTSDPSRHLNRAAMTSPPLASLLLARGRHTVGPLVERYLARLAGEGVLAHADTGVAFRDLYGLVVADAQVRVLLGEDPPSGSAIRDAAERAVASFLTLHARPGWVPSGP